MGLLSSNKSNKDDKKQDKDPKVKVKRTETREKSYTVHTAEIHYSNGEKEEVDFDAMYHKDECVILKNYTGYSTGTYGGGFNSEAIATLPYVNFNKIHTVNRRKETMEYEKTVTTYKKKSEVTEDEKVIP